MFVCWAAASFFHVLQALMSVLFSNHGRYWIYDDILHQIPEIILRIPKFKLREAFQSKKQRNFGISPKWWWPPPLAGLGIFWTLLKWVPLKSTWAFFELGIFWKWNDPLKILRNKLNMNKNAKHSKSARSYIFVCLRHLLKKN